MASECLPKLHRLVMVYSRPWTRLFRKQWKLCCQHCCYVIPLPHLRTWPWKLGSAPVRSGPGLMSPPEQS